MQKHKYQTFTFGTWNVQGLGEKKREVLSEIRRENHDVVVLTETKLRGVGDEDLEDYFHYYSGINNGPSRAGVSILLKKQLAIDSKWKSISERLIVAEFKICERTVVVIGVYWLDDCAKPVLKEAFRNKLRSEIENVDEKHELIILGDFNSRVGVDQSSCVVGKYGEPEVNQNGRILVKMCKDLNLKIQNTFFKHEDKHKFTWYHSVQPLRTLIDFCITRQDPGFVVDDVKACRWMNCKSDHVFLETSLSFEIPNIGDVSKQPEDNSVTEKYRTYLLYSKQIQNSYMDYLNVEIDITDSQTTNEIYQCLKDSIHSAASFVLGKETNNNYGEFLWDQEVRDLQEFRQRNRYQSETSKLYLGMDINESLLKNIKNEVWEGICSEINSTQKCRKNKIVWDIVNDIQNKPPRTFEMHTEHLVSGLNFKHSTELDTSAYQLNISNNQHQESLLNINIRDVDTALNHLEDSNVPVPGGLTIKLLKHSSNKAKILLKKLIQNIFNGEEVPKEISEMYCIYDTLNNGETLTKHNKYSCHSIMRVMRFIVNNILSKCCTLKDFYHDLSINSYSDAIFILRQIIQKTAGKQIPSFHCLFLDLKNLFSDIECSQLLRCLDKENISCKLKTIIEHLYEGTNGKVVESGRLFDEFCSCEGLTNDSLTCTLFKKYTEKALKTWSEENEEHGVAIGNKRLLFLLLRDLNLVILSESKLKLKTVITSLKLHLLTAGLNLNVKCIKYLSNEEIDIDGTKIIGTEIVHLNNFVLDYDGRNAGEIFQRVFDAREAIGTLHPVARDKMITEKNKKRIFKSVIRNLLLYGCETWTMANLAPKGSNRHIDSKQLLEDTELNYWKWCCENYPQRYSKQEIYDLMNVKDTVYYTVMLKRAAFYTHIMDADRESWLRQVMDWEPEGVLRCGRPRKKWMDGLADFLNSFGNYQMYFQKKKDIRKHTNSSNSNVHGEEVKENGESVMTL